MNKKQEEIAFCQAYLQCLDPQQAAQCSGGGDGYELLSRKNVQNRLKKMRTAAAAQIRREDVLCRLAQLAFGRGDDVIKLALQREKSVPEKLDLSAVSELKVSDRGVEVKLVDRVRALECLYQLLQVDPPHGSEDLYQALTQTAEEMGEDWDEE